MTPVSAFAGVAQSRAANAPASHVLRFISWPSFPLDVCGSAPYPFSGNRFACQIRPAYASREDAKPFRKTPALPLREARPTKPVRSFLHTWGRTERKNRGERLESSLR